MHIQARVTLRQAAGTATAAAAEQTDAVSATYGAGSLAGVLQILEREGFDLESAGGRQIELGGEFAFSVRARAQDRDHDAATRAAVGLLKSEGYEAHWVKVHTRVLDDEQGALLRYVEQIAGRGLLIEEIAIGAASAPGRVPVQVYTASIAAGEPPAGGAPASGAPAGEGPAAEDPSGSAAGQDSGPG